MSENLVVYENRPPATVITINRPERRNALSRQLIAGLQSAFDRAREDSQVRCAILTGTGSAFCAGMDLSELAETLDRQESGVEGAEAAVWEDALRLATLYDLIYRLPKPTIAAVNGPAVAGGAGLVTVCDLALAVPSATFGYPEVRRGLVAAMVMPHLLRHVSERMGRYLLLSGELVDAAQAKETGLINEIVPAQELMPRSFAWAGSLAEGGPDALAATKSLLRQFSRQALSVEEAAKASAAPRIGEECKSGLRAFFEKRPAPWSPQA